MSYLIYGVKIWKVTNTKLASCVIQGKWEKEKKYKKNIKDKPLLFKDENPNSAFIVRPF